MRFAKNNKITRNDSHMYLPSGYMQRNVRVLYATCYVLHACSKRLIKDIFDYARLHFPEW